MIARPIAGAIAMPMAISLDGTYLGPELVVNGDFSDGTNNWTPLNSPVLSVSNNSVKIEMDAISNPFIHQEIPTEAGENYRVTFTLTGISPAENSRVALGASSSSNTPSLIVTEVGNHSFDAAATEALSNIKLQSLVDATGEFAELSNISVRKINSV